MINGLEIKNRILGEVGKAVVGKESIVELMIATVFAGGHILLEDIPGVGKTTLALALSKTLSLGYNRMQFTPDVMPSDVMGFSVYDNKTGQLSYKQGSIMCNLFLADEINRTSSKTQSALLEAMEEGKVTVDSVTRELPQPFVVIATQNPTGSAGTTLLPDSQLDRFMVKLSMGYPDMRDEVNILKSKYGGVNPLLDIKKVLNEGQILTIKKAVSEIFVHDSMYEYIVMLVNATRTNDLLEVGISPRGTVAITNLAKAVAFLNNRNYIVPDDVKQIFIPATNHRVILSTKAKMAKCTSASILLDILNSIRMVQQ